MIDLDQVARHLKIAELAIAHHEAKIDAKAAKGLFYEAWHRFEAEESGFSAEDAEHVRWTVDWINKSHPRYEYACVVTRPEYDNYKVKKRREYNAKRRLENAIRRAA